jgi:hypothetical protein
MLEQTWMYFKNVWCCFDYISSSSDFHLSGWTSENNRSPNNVGLLGCQCRWNERSPFLRTSVCRRMVNSVCYVRRKSANVCGERKEIQVKFIRDWRAVCPTYPEPQEPTDKSLIIIGLREFFSQQYLQSCSDKRMHCNLFRLQYSLCHLNRQLFAFEMKLFSTTRETLKLIRFRKNKEDVCSLQHECNRLVQLA